jgi:hypothetical protein
MGVFFVTQNRYPTETKRGGFKKFLLVLARKVYDLYPVLIQYKI